MTNQYVQTVEVDLRQGARRDQILGIVLQLLGLGLILAGVFVSYYFFIAVAFALAVGIYLTQRFYSTAKQFEYDFNNERLVISRTNIVNHRRRILEIVYGDVKSFTYFRDVVFPTDIVATGKATAQDVKAMIFTADGKEMRLLFEPDDYMALLISERLRRGKVNTEENGAQTE